MTSEPTMSSEDDFQSAVLSVLRLRLEAHAQTGVQYAILEPFGLDAAILIKSPSDTAVRLIEFKAYSGQRPGGIGFGNQKGEGPQVDLLMLSDSLLSSLGRSVRWCLADLTRPHGQRRYSVITCAEAKHAAMGTVRHGKQNNFRVKDALCRPLTWNELLGALETFLLGGN